MAGEDTLLAGLDRATDALQPTRLFAELEARIAEECPNVVILDTLADLHPANENERAKARQFIGLIRGLAVRNGCAVVLLAHPSLSDMASGDGTSGSTAWNNSVRSRVYFSRVKGDDGFESDADVRVLTTKKNNYARVGTETLVRWQAGVFVPAVTPVVGGETREAKAERAFMELLTLHMHRGEWLRAGTGSPAYAPKVFANHPQGDGLNVKDYSRAMDRLLVGGTITIKAMGTQRNGKPDNYLFITEREGAPCRPPFDLHPFDSLKVRGVSA